MAVAVPCWCLGAGIGSCGQMFGRDRKSWRSGIMGKVTNSAVEARRRAKERRIKLYEDRAAKDERIETAAAAFFVAQTDRTVALAAIDTADSALAGQVRTLTDDEGLTVAQAADLLDVDAAEVRRLVKLAGDAAPAKSAEKSADAAGSKVEQVVGA